MDYFKMFKQFKNHGFVSKQVMYLSQTRDVPLSNMTDTCAIAISLLH